MAPIVVNNCHKCNGFRSMALDGAHISCEKCDVSANVLCPHCNIGQLTELNGTLVCQHCNKTTPLATMHYILSNHLKTHETKRCHFCNGPTLVREDSNIHPRCFNYPDCGNQENLFKEENNQTLIFFDIETTGLDMGIESIIEIGACKVDKQGKEYFFKEFIKPSKSVSSLITKITGIEPHMVEHAPRLKPVLDEFVSFCGDDAYLVAHNAQFDVPWLMCCMMRHNMRIKFSNVLCTLNWAKQMEEGKRSLGALSKKYGIGHENAHRALADAVVTKQLYYIYDQEPDSEPPFESIDRYVEMSKKTVAQYPDFKQE